MDSKKLVENNVARKIIEKSNGNLPVPPAPKKPPMKKSLLPKKAKRTPADGIEFVMVSDDELKLSYPELRKKRFALRKAEQAKKKPKVEEKKDEFSLDKASLRKLLQEVIVKLDDVKGFQKLVNQAHDDLDDCRVDLNRAMLALRNHCQNITYDIDLTTFDECNEDEDTDDSAEY